MKVKCDDSTSDFRDTLPYTLNQLNMTLSELRQEDPSEKAVDFNRKQAGFFLYKSISIRLLILSCNRQSYMSYNADELSYFNPKRRPVSNLL